MLGVVANVLCNKAMYVVKTKEIIILLEGNLLKPGNPYFGLTDQPTNQQLTTEELKDSSNSRARQC
jgi:hypothetical protein